MDFGITESHVGDIDFIVRAEKLGYTHCAVTDSHLLRSHFVAVLALAAVRTKTIKLGTGVMVAGLRLAPVAANAMATINRLAPGRTYTAIGTGNTAMRLMGQPPMRFREFREYIRVMRALLRDEEVAYTHQGSTHPIRFGLRDHKYIDLEHHIPLYVGGNGPMTQSLAGELGDGLMTSLPPGGTVASAMENVRRGRQKAGLSLEGFHLAALFTLVMLEPGEAVNSERVLAESGPAIMAQVHAAVDQVKESGGEPPEFVKPIWNEYREFNESRPAETRHQQLHASHRTYLDPQEARFLTPEVIRRAAVVGRPEEVIEQIREFEKQGLRQFKFSPPPARKLQAVERFARQIIAKY
jgi:alkanesulfonate monooxygenase SsuD/methylene tetrahydromethanopterin reductase-like flavin-dependent oxidoreductase (luciferase family)